MDNPYYFLAEKLKVYSKRIWIIILFSIVISVIFQFLGYVFEGVDKLDNGKSLFGLLGVFAFIPTILLFLFVFPVSETFARLENEKAIYQSKSSLLQLLFASPYAH